MRTPRTWIWQRDDWPNFRWDMTALAPTLAAARLAQGKILGAARLLDPDLTLEAVGRVLVEDGLMTSAIEGENLNAESVRSSVARHLGLPTAGLPHPTREVDGLIEVLLDATRRHDEPLTLERLCGWQAALFPSGFSSLHRIRVGALRGDEPVQVVSGRLGSERVHFVAPDRARLDADVTRFLAWFAEPPQGLDGLVRASLAHLWFVTLHPFEDGNGRLSRAITDMALAQDERERMRYFSLSAQIMREREGYYAILERTQHGDLDVTPWLGWHLEQLEKAAVAALDTLSRTLEKARFWLRHRAVTINDRQRKALNRLLDVGPEGVEGGINTRKYAGIAHVSRATAFRELADLVEKGLLVPTGKGGRSTAYTITWPEQR